MAGEKGIEVDVGITLNKLIRQLASAEARFEKAAKRASGAFDKSNKQIEQSFGRVSKSAQASANTFARDLDKMRAKYDPLFAASKRYERELEELNRAHKLGAINADQHAAALQRLNASMAVGSGGAQAAASSVRGLGARMAGARGQIQNAAFQIGDFAVQVGAGQRASTALAQQLPQLLGGFGALGAVLGAAVAIGVPLAASFFTIGQEAEEYSETVNRLREAIDAYTAAAELANLSTDDLIEKFGSAAEELRPTIELLAQLQKQTALTELTAAAAAFSEEFDGLFSNLGARGNAGTAALARVRDEFGITREEAYSLRDAINAVGAATGPEEVSAAARELNDLLIEVYGSVSEIPEAFVEVATAAADADVSATELQATIEETVGSVADLVSGIYAIDFSNAISGANSLLGVLQQALATAAAMAEQRIRNGGRDNSEIASLAAQYEAYGMGRQAFDRRAAEIRYAPPPPPPAPGGGGGGGGSSSGSDPFAGFAESLEKDVVALERRITLIGKTESEIAGLTTKYKLLDEAKRRNLDLDRDYNRNGETLRQEIDRQAEAVANLTAQYEQAAERAEFFDSQQKSLKEGFLDAAIEGESFAGVLRDVAKAFARASLESALFNTGPLAGGAGSGGGLFGKILGVLGGGGGGGLFASASAPTPQISAPSASAFASGNLVGRPAPITGRGAAAASPPVDVRLYVEAVEGDMFRPIIRAESAGAMVRVVDQNNQRIPAMVAEAQRRTFR